MKALPESTLVTIDGCYSDAMTGATILDRYGIRGVFFVIPKRVGTSGRLTWAQIHDLYDRGHRIGNLSWSHPETLVGVTEDQLDWQIKQAQDRLELEGVASPLFAYPNGLYDQPVVDYLAAHGFTDAYTVGTPEVEGPLTQSRLKVTDTMTTDLLLQAVA
jgi:peptidoglycan/xylan/chitin deacetylase (PgdA/CDA1 family)